MSPSRGPLHSLHTDHFSAPTLACNGRYGSPGIFGDSSPKMEDSIIESHLYFRTHSLQSLPCICPQEKGTQTLLTQQGKLPSFSLSPSRALWGNVSSRALNKAGILGDACLILPSTGVVGYFWGWKFRNETLFLWVSMVTLCDTGKHLGAAGISGKQERRNLN